MLIIAQMESHWANDQHIWQVSKKNIFMESLFWGKRTLRSLDLVHC
jgi:hypothetical protein